MESTDEKLGLRHGLGLLIVRQVVNAHDGELEIDGAMQEGFSTTITL